MVTTKAIVEEILRGMEQFRSTMRGSVGAGVQQKKFDKEAMLHLKRHGLDRFARMATDYCLLSCKESYDTIGNGLKKHIKEKKEEFF